MAEDDNPGKKKKAKKSINKINKRHGPLLPDSIRCIICGPSNCGKTDLMLKLLVYPKGLRFSNCYVYSKSLNQKKYQFLQDIFNDIDDMEAEFISDHEDMLEPGAIKPDSVVVFDDMATEKQDIIRSYFSMGRHSGADSFYLAQSYGRIPKHLIRDNANLLMIFKQDDLNLRRVYEDHVSSDMTLDEFRKMCRECWKTNKYSYLVIDTNSPRGGGRYRRGLDEFIQPE